jgi:hypothetical protein
MCTHQRGKNSNKIGAKLATLIACIIETLIMGLRSRPKTIFSSTSQSGRKRGTAGEMKPTKGIHPGMLTNRTIPTQTKLSKNLLRHTKKVCSFGTSLDTASSAIINPKSTQATIHLCDYIREESYQTLFSSRTTAPGVHVANGCH